MQMLPGMSMGSPQWSPPLKGGSTTGTARGAVTVNLAAMEPAVERREHPVRFAAGVADDVAAMEPAVERREHRPRQRQRYRQLLAAMEPAVERREHNITAPATPNCAPPQWSPPLKGGSTRPGSPRVPVGEAAAMEPAVERREHRGGRAGQGACRRAAMEPAVERREHIASAEGVPVTGQPQWSPPLKGGSTSAPWCPGKCSPGRNGARR